MQQITRDDVEFTLEVYPDNTLVRGNAMAIDPGTDRQYEDWIIGRLNDGDIWAWAVVKVTAKLPSTPLEGVDILGGCTYEDEDDFKKSQYYEDMINEAFQDLREQVKRTRTVIYGTAI